MAAGAERGEMTLLVLAGGFGTRLKSAVGNVPKALAPVEGTPFLQLQIRHWVAQGVRSFVFLLHHEAAQVIDFLRCRRDDLLKDCSVAWTVEPKPMDTGGAVAYAIRDQRIVGDVLVSNADTWLGSGIREMREAVSPAMAVVRVRDVARYGEVVFDEGCRVTSFNEKGGQGRGGWINAGLCRLCPALFDDWHGNVLSLERDVFPALVKEGALGVVRVNTDFIDIGVPQDYRRFCAWEAAGGREGLL